MGEGARSEGPTSTDNAGQTKLKLRRAANNMKHYIAAFVASSVQRERRYAAPERARAVR